MRVSGGFIIMYAVNTPSSFDEVSTFIEQVKRVKDSDDVPMVSSYSYLEAFGALDVHEKPDFVFTF
jgi:hypothetical protein